MTTTTRTTRARRRPVRAAALTLALTLASAACTGEEPGDGAEGGERLAASMSALFEQYLARDDLSDFEREVLERSAQTGVISAEDYERAHAREADCVAQAGYEVGYEKLPNGLYRITPDLPELADEDAAEQQLQRYLDDTARCAAGVNRVIESLYVLQQGNPDLLADPDEAVVQCLRRAGLVPGDYTADTFASDLTDSFAGASFDPSDAVVQGCFAGAGIAYAAAPEAGR